MISTNATPSTVDVPMEQSLGNPLPELVQGQSDMLLLRLADAREPCKSRSSRLNDDRKRPGSPRPWLI